MINEEHKCLMISWFLPNNYKKTVLSEFLSLRSCCLDSPRSPLSLSNTIYLYLHLSLISKKAGVTPCGRWTDTET